MVLRNTIASILTLPFLATIQRIDACFMHNQEPCGGIIQAINKKASSFLNTYKSNMYKRA